jgi:hypothetical protein
LIFPSPRSRPQSADRRLRRAFRCRRRHRFPLRSRCGQPDGKTPRSAGHNRGFSKISNIQRPGMRPGLKCFWGGLFPRQQNERTITPDFWLRAVASRARAGIYAGVLRESWSARAGRFCKQCGSKTIAAGTTVQTQPAAAVSTPGSKPDFIRPPLQFILGALVVGVAGVWGKALNNEHRIGGGRRRDTGKRKPWITRTAASYCRLPTCKRSSEWRSRKRRGSWKAPTHVLGTLPAQASCARRTGGGGYPHIFSSTCSSD